MNQAKPGLYGDLLYRGGDLVVVRSLIGSVECPDWTADVTAHGHLMFLNIAIDPATGKVYASGKANTGAAVVIVGPDEFETVIPGGYGNYPSQLAIVDGRVVCYVVLNFTQYGMFDLAGKLIETRSIPGQYYMTSQGIRFVDDAGAVRWGDETQAGIFEGLVIREWMQRGGYTGGQDQDSGFALSGNGIATRYPSGNTFFPRIAVDGSRLALLYVNGASVYWDTLTLPLEAIPPVPTVKPPTISVTSYDKVLKAGEPWALEFAAVDTRFLVTKDAKDRVWIEAQNAAGSDRTGTIRQLTIEGPDPEPEPEPDPMPLLGRYWLQPNIGSLDLVEMFERFTGFDLVDVFVLPIQNILVDEPNGQVNANTYPNLVNAHAFRSLHTAQIPFVIEAGAVKNEDCTGTNYLSEMRTALARVRVAGGEVAAFSMDEPITNSKRCTLTFEQLADRTAAYVRACREEGVGVGWLEAWPNIALADQKRFLELLAVRHALPDYWHPDIDHKRARDERKDVAQFIAEAQKIANLYGITLGVFVNSTVDPTPNEATHYGNLHQLARKLQTMHPLAAHVHVAAWCRRGSNTGPQDVPDNLSLYGLVASLADTRAVFDATPIPDEEDPMVQYAPLTDPGTRTIAAKELRPIPGRPGLYTLILPDDTVFSQQPNGSDESRPDGTAGQYEQCKPAGGNAVVYNPTENGKAKYITRAYVLVGGL